jgi:hypothetical protein
MPAQTGPYLFLLGLAAGIGLLTLTAYRSVTPSWLRRVLTLAGILTIARYASMAVLTMMPDPPAPWLLARAWYGSSIGLTLPSVVAIDQLVRHPAMTPNKLLTWFSPFLGVYAAVLAFGVTVPPIGDPILTGPWRMVLGITQAVFAVGFIGACGLFAMKVPVRPMRAALIVLAAAHLYLAADGLIVTAGGWYFRPFLFSEMVALVALWFAYETAAGLQTNR